MNAYHKELLEKALGARQKEVIEYQVNIDNFRLAIERIGDDPDLQAFKEGLVSLLASNLLEQKKAQVILDVISFQLEDSK